MEKKPHKKKAGLIYKFGRGIVHSFSGIKGESDREVGEFEDSVIDELLTHFLKDKLIKLLDNNDVDYDSDATTQELIDIARKLTLVKIERFILKDLELRVILSPDHILPTDVSEFLSLVLNIHEEIHWAVESILSDILNEKSKKYEERSFREHWLRKMRSSLDDINESINQLEKARGKLEKAGFESRIYYNVLQTSGECADHYENVLSSLNNGDWIILDLESLKNELWSVLDKLDSEADEIKQSSHKSETVEDPSLLMKKIVDLRELVNNIFLGKIGFNLLINDEPLTLRISGKCADANAFLEKISALSTLIDETETDKLNSKLSVKLEGAAAVSINILEKFLGEKFPGYDPIIITNLRDIKSIRKQSPIHPNKKAVLIVNNRVCGSYMITDFRGCWERVLNLYVESLEKMTELLKTSNV